MRLRQPEGREWPQGTWWSNTEKLIIKCWLVKHQYVSILIFFQCFVRHKQNSIHYHHICLKSQRLISSKPGDTIYKAYPLKQTFISSNAFTTDLWHRWNIWAWGLLLTFSLRCLQRLVVLIGLTSSKCFLKVIEVQAFCSLCLSPPLFQSLCC